VRKQTKPKAKKITEAKGAALRSARIYRVVESKAKQAEKLTATQTTQIYAVLARNPSGLSAEQIVEKLSADGKFKSENPRAVVNANLYDLRRGTASCKNAGPGLVEIVEKAPAEKKPKGAKPKATQHKLVEKIEKENKVVALLEENRKKNTPAA